MFEPKNKVKAKNPNLPFWMVVDRVNEELGFAYCSFGYSGKYAGAFRFDELVPYEFAEEDE